MVRGSMLAIALGMLGLTALAACGVATGPATGGGGSASGAAASAAVTAPAVTPTPERLKMSYAALAAHFAPSWVAREAGLFAKYGIDAELTHLPSRQASAALVSGDVDYGFFSGRTVVELRTQGADVVAVAAPILKLIQSVMVVPEIRQPADLRGKRLAVSQFGSIVDYSGRYLLNQWGLKPDEDVSLVQLQTLPNILAAMESRAVEGGVLSPPTSLQAAGMGYRELGTMHSQPFEYPASTVVVRGSTLRERPDQVQRVVNAVTEAIAKIKNDRAFAETTIKEYTQIDDPESLRVTYDLYAPAFERLPLVTESAMQAAIDELAAESPRAREVQPAQTMDLRFVRELEAAGLLKALYP
jgi:NitT/TauT family transport system substrate-binding protein